jgi:hypothetical protein
MAFTTVTDASVRLEHTLRCASVHQQRLSEQPHTQRFMQTQRSTAAFLLCDKPVLARAVMTTNSV